MGPDAYPVEWTQDEIAEYEEMVYGEPCDCGLQGPNGGFVVHAEGAPGCELEPKTVLDAVRMGFVSPDTIPSDVTGEMPWKEVMGRC